MHFSTSNTDLYKALDAVGGALPSKPDKEILGCILMQRQGDSLELRATDNEISIRHRLQVEFLSEPEGESDMIAVPAKQFLESCRMLPDIPITFEVGENYDILLSHDRGNYKWKGFNGDDFPVLPLIENPQSVEFDRARLKTGFNLVGFAVSKDISRPQMMGILFEILEGSARIVATDGHRLARCIFRKYEGKLDLKALAPLSAFQQATRIEDSNDCTILVDENHIAFDFGSTYVISRLLNRQFPDYERAIPDENDKVLQVSRNDILNSVRRVNLFASVNSNHILLECQDGQIKVRAWDVERSSKGAEDVTCEYNGEATEIGFNAQYLQELLRHLPAEEISMSMGLPSRAALLEPAPQGDLEDITYLIMPIMLNKIE